ncbi:MAG: hypothetical protein M3O32_03675 [Actinomycetota bacterium]|nr:hypothetical protein [Actinomycetota bacterium]
MSLRGGRQRSTGQPLVRDMLLAAGIGGDDLALLAAAVLETQDRVLALLLGLYRALGPEPDPWVALASAFAETPRFEMGRRPSGAVDADWLRGQLVTGMTDVRTMTGLLLEICEHGRKEVTGNG